MLDDLKNFDKDRTGREYLVELSAFARAYRTECDLMGEEVPAWVDEQTRILRREIHSRQQDAVSARLAKAKARLASLATPEEKRAALKAEIDELEAREAKGA